MISIYDYLDYRCYLKLWIKSHKLKGGQGQLAKAAGISSTMMSLILKGEKQFSFEQGMDLASFLGLTTDEESYLLNLIGWSRAGNIKLKEKLFNQINEQQKQVKKRVHVDYELTDKDISVFYSSWTYSAIRNASALRDMTNEVEIAKRLGLSISVVRRVLNFLLEYKLCLNGKEGLTNGPANTYLSVDSVHVNRHHQNWRHKAINKMEEKEDQDLFFTMPMSLSRDDIQRIRSLILKLISETSKIVAPSSSEEIICLNIDLFKI